MFPTAELPSPITKEPLANALGDMTLTIVVPWLLWWVESPP
jgi:hypothetical protein